MALHINKNTTDSIAITIEFNIFFIQSGETLSANFHPVAPSQQPLTDRPTSFDTVSEVILKVNLRIQKLKTYLG